MYELQSKIGTKTTTLHIVSCLIPLDLHHSSPSFNLCRYQSIVLNCIMTYRPLPLLLSTGFDAGLIARAMSGVKNLVGHIISSCHLHTNCPGCNLIFMISHIKGISVYAVKSASKKNMCLLNSHDLKVNCRFCYQSVIHSMFFIGYDD